MTNLQDILNTRADEVEKPKPLPVGTYTAKALKLAFDVTKSENQTPYARVTFGIEAPGPDVSSEALEAYGKSPIGKEINKDFYLTDDAMYRFTAFMQDALGINLSGRTLRESASEIIGRRCLITVTQTPSKKDPSVVYSNVDDCAAIEE